MEKDLKLTITSLESVDSTQIYLKSSISSGKMKAPCAVVAQKQTKGIGSRNNAWIGEEGNLFLSFALPVKSLPKDLDLQSSSIYFSYLLKETLCEMGSKVWLKWPNDFYLGQKKLGGMITNIVSDTLVCGVGINLVSSPEGFTKIDVEISKENLLQSYFIKIENMFTWKQIFSKYKIEFLDNKMFFTHNNGLKFSLEKAILQDDGSIVVDGERIYSTR